MDITIGEDFRARDVDVTLGVMQFRVETLGVGAGRALMAALAEEVKPTLEGHKPAELDAVAATRKAYRALGKDPGRYRPSSEALLRRIASGKDLPSVNDVVDAGNLISIKSQLSLGAYNAARIKGPVTFRRAGDGESADAIGRGTMNFEFLPVFADDIGPFGSPTSDTERTMVTQEARSILMVLIAFTRDETMADRMGESRPLLEEVAGARDIASHVVRNWA